MKNLYGALLKAQQEFSAVPKDGKNPHLNSRYATLGSVQETAFPTLHKHGLIVLQSVRTEWAERGPVVYVGATLVHAESGESTAQELGLIPVKLDPQGIGSAISYGRRYILLTMLGLSAEDDDGNAAAGQKAQPTQRPAQAAPRPPGPENDVDFRNGAPDLTKTPAFKKMQATAREKMGERWTSGEGREFLKSITGKESTRSLTAQEIANMIDALNNYESAPPIHN